MAFEQVLLGAWFFSCFKILGDWVVLALPVLRRSLAWNIGEAFFYAVIAGLTRNLLAQ
jgi:hypothetical protein